ncbi:glycosyltransferase family 2 protein [Bifidobacterium bifidum]|uniref:glycosyltransferase family 2 protein n=1 Tax=Bifidobacterium bifidum TaxID=1681 RepID=UPI0012ABB6DA|nr:glycosyltransferase family 2 protein [Bifidobacterium bifidum]
MHDESAVGSREPLVSVIIPVYKVKEYLDTCVKSIVGQTYRNLQIVLVDDGSPDSCPMLCDEWASRDSRISVVHKRNGGLGSARNAGMKVSTGEYIWFVDSDDFVDLNVLEQVVSAAQRNQSDIIIFSNTNDLYADGKYSMIGENPVIEFTANDNDEFKDVFGRLTDAYLAIPAWNKLYRRAFLQEHDAWFNESVNVAEDQIFNIALYPHARKVSGVVVRGYHYVLRPGSLSSNTFNPKTLESRLRAYRLVHDVLSDWNPDALNFYRNELLMQISVIVDSLYVRHGGLSAADRLDIINEIMNDDDVCEAAREAKTLSHRNGYIAWCVRHRFVIGLKVYGRIVAGMKSLRRK